MNNDIFEKFRLNSSYLKNFEKSKTFEVVLKCFFLLEGRIDINFDGKEKINEILKFISVNLNYIYFQSGAFFGLASLEVLDLSDSHLLEYIDEDAFEVSHALRIFNVGFCALKTFPPTLFDWKR